MKSKRTRWLIILIAFALLMVTGTVLLITGEVRRLREIDTFVRVSEVMAVEQERSTPGAGAESTADINGNAAGSPESVVSDSEIPAAEKSNAVEAVSAVNTDCIGWLTIDGTPVVYPVMHTPDEPLRYIDHDFYGKKSSSGVPFLDARCDLSSDNLILYGHRMKNGTMFACLKKYKNEQYRAEHPEIILNTSAGVRKYKVFAVLTVNKTDSWYAFTSALNQEEYDSMIDYAVMNSVVETDGRLPEYGTQLISLSTCYGSGSSGRLIVIGTEEE